MLREIFLESLDNCVSKCKFVIDAIMRDRPLQRLWYHHACAVVFPLILGGQCASSRESYSYYMCIKGTADYVSRYLCAYAVTH